ncbi:MAG: carboxylesterase family protein [Treponema sp.]|nr:carboxylesterase family protein [Treponema sp.]
MITLKTKCGNVKGIENQNGYQFLGLPYAKAGRFEYAKMTENWEGTFDASHNGPCCPQTRTYYEHLENPARYFYYREFRDGIKFTYDEDCLNCNIFTPKEPGKYPVIIYFHGGSFNSGSNSEEPFDGQGFAKRGIVTVFVNYRVGLFGYMSHQEIQKKYGRNGNFGFDDQYTAIKWVKENISDYYGDPENITLMGQSAGAIAIQYLCLSKKCQGLFKNAVMMSGGGKFPDFSLPRKAEDTQNYWLEFMQACGCPDFDEFKKIDCQKIFDVMEEFKKNHKDNMFNTMPVIDGYLLDSPVKEAIKNPLKINYMLGYTNSDMYAPLLAYVNHKYVKKNSGYLYYFDINLKGDKMKAFHSADLRFMFNRLKESWRPFDEKDQEIADLMQDYLANFARNGNPNGKNLEGKELPLWKKTGRKAIHLKLRKENQKQNSQIKMTSPHYFRLFWNFITQLNLI